MRFGEREIFRTRDLDVERIAGNDLHVIAVMCGQACFVGGVELLALGARERIAKNVEAKTLRRLSRQISFANVSIRKKGRTASCTATTS